MDVTTFYALFSATCFTLVGLWWGVALRDLRWVAEPARRRAVGGVYLAFLLPALMGLFAQIGGVDNQLVWRTSFAVIATVGSLTTLFLLATNAEPGVTVIRVSALLIYVAVAIVGVFPQVADLVGLRPIQVAALLLVLLVALGHALVWHFLVQGVTRDLR